MTHAFLESDQDPQQRTDLAGSPDDGTWLNLVSEKVKTLHYGVVQIVVHGGRVVQVERTERHRFDVRSKA